MCEQAANQSRWRETRLVLKLCYTDSKLVKIVTLANNAGTAETDWVMRLGSPN